MRAGPALVAAAVVAALAAPPAGILDRDVGPKPGGEGTELSGRQDWFYRQRAYPNARIGRGALQRARGQADLSPVVGDATVSTGSTTASPSATVALQWNQLGPQPITGPAGNWTGVGPWSGRVA